MSATISSRRASSAAMPTAGLSVAAKPLTLAQVVSLKSRFTRSAHLERDFASGDAGDYHLTPSAYELLKAVALAWEQPAERAMTLVGPYGAGKSAFCVFLAQLVSGEASAARRLKTRDASLWRALCGAQRRLLPVLVVGARTPLAPALVAGLVKTLENGGHEAVLRGLQSKFSSVLQAASPEPRAVADLYAHAAHLAAQNGTGGLLLIADEVGKFLEYAALHPREGDIFVLQELAEAAARSQRMKDEGGRMKGKDEAKSGGASTASSSFFVLAALHQNAEAYAQKLGRAHQAEWAKVGERFRQVPFFPSDAERMDMVGLALEQQPHLHLNGHLAPLSDGCLPLLPAGLGQRFAPLAEQSYPLHPLVLLALPALFRKTGQSHRSLFNFLAGEEAHALGRFLRETTFTPEAPPLFMLDALFDYAGETLLGGWSVGALARSWAEATETVERAINVSPLARRILKCIGLLGLLRDPKLPPSLPVLSLALTPAGGAAPDVAEAIEELRQKRFVAYSRTHDTYRLWEGGDVDVEAELQAARASLPPGVSLRVATERDLAAPPRMVARRHSYQTGTLRTVAVKPCALGELASAIERAQNTLSVLLCLVTSEDDAERAEELARGCKRPNVLIALARETEALRLAASDLAAAHSVEQNVAALQSDRAARRELDARRFEAQGAFRDEWQRLFGSHAAGDDAADAVAEDESALWFYRGKPHRFDGSRAFAEFLSQMADRTFVATPTLRNELINRRALSSAAAAGRRALIEAMLLHGDKPRLTFSGFPPELSMYECLLRATGLHRETAPGIWEWGAPPDDDPANLGLVWDELERTLFSGPPAPQSVAELWKRLAAPPFGLSEGVMPPLLLAFLLAHRHETTLYRQGTFVAEPSVADWEVLLRRPEFFAVAGCRLEGARRVLIERLAQGFGVQPFLVPVVRELLARVRRLPVYAWKTQNLPPHILRLRAAIENARSPEKLLLADIPDALELGGEDAGLFDTTGDANNFFETLNDALTQWSRAMPQVLETARDSLLTACSLPVGATGWAALRARCTALEGHIAQAALVPFVGRAAMPGDDATVLDSVLAQVAGCPPRSWSDADVERFPAACARIGELLKDEGGRIRKDEEVLPSSLSPRDLKRSRDLAQRIKDQWRASAKPPAPDVARAALLLLLQEMDTKGEG